MMKNMRLRLTLTVLVIAVPCWRSTRPTRRSISGSTSRAASTSSCSVKTDDALRSESQITAERLRDTLTRDAVQFTDIEVTASDQFRVTE